MQRRGVDRVRAGSKRWRAAAAAERASLACLLDRSSRPLASPRAARRSRGAHRAARRETGWGPRLLAGVTGLPHQTVWKVLHRNGCSRRARAAARAGQSVRVAVPGRPAAHGRLTLRALRRPGHAMTGDRRSTTPTSSAATATSTPTRSSTTTPAWPTSSCTPTSASRPSLAFTRRALAWYRRPRHHSAGA